jgi:hypothetical protein
LVNHPYVRALGADQVSTYNAREFTAIGSICDLVFDTVGGGFGRAPTRWPHHLISGANKASLLPFAAELGSTGRTRQMTAP